MAVFSDADRAEIVPLLVATYKKLAASLVDSFTVGQQSTVMKKMEAVRIELAAIGADDAIAQLETIPLLGVLNNAGPR